MNQAEQFFYDHAGYSYDPKTETEAEGRLRTAREYAAAEAAAKERDWAFMWEYDQEGCIGCECESDDCACFSGTDHETLACILRDGDGTEADVLASLSGICGADANYRRVVEAELAAEALEDERKAAEAQECALMERASG